MKKLLNILGLLIFSTCISLPSFGAPRKQVPDSLQSALKSAAVKITFPSDGEPVYDYYPSKVTSYYNSTNETVTIVGAFRNVPANLVQRGKIKFFFNGSSRPARVRKRMKIRRVRHLELASGTFTQDVYFGRDYYWPTRGITVEMTDSRKRKVYSRDRIVLYDLRNDAFATPFMPTDSNLIGMTSQLTDPGIGYLINPDELTGMESAHLATLPQPDLSTFNTRLTNNFHSVPHYDDDDNQLNTCIDLEDLDEGRFRNVLFFAPYAEVLAEAESQYLLYEQRDSICPALVQPALIAACYLAFEGSCVKEEPDASDFELCVDQIEGQAQTLTINNVSNSKLRFLNSNSSEEALIKSHITVNGIHGKVDGYIRGISVRWKNSTCVPRPKATLNDDTIPETTWIDEWATCRNMQINYSNANTALNDRYATFSAHTDPNDDEGILVSQVSPGTFTFSGETTRADQGSCALDFLLPDSQDMLNTFTSELQDQIGSTWFAGAPYSQQAVALSKLFSTYRLGKIEVPDHTINAKFVSIDSNEGSGMHLYWNTLVDFPANITAEFARKVRHNFFFSLPGYSTATVSTEGLDSLQNSFGISHSVTTGFLNQILNMRSATDKLYFNYQPTWGELSIFGVNTPAGASSNDPATLNENTLHQFDSAFSGFGNKELQIEITPLKDPFIFMPSDLPNGMEIQNVGMPTTYGIDSFEVNFKEPDRTTARGKKIKGTSWLKLHLQMVDYSFYLSIDPSQNALFYVPHLTDDRWTVFVVNSILDGCGMSPRGITHISSCERRLEDKLSRLLQMPLRPVFIDLLSNIPAPEYFDALGDTRTPVHFTEQSRHQEAQYITHFGQVEVY